MSSDEPRSEDGGTDLGSCAQDDDWDPTDLLFELKDDR